MTKTVLFGFWVWSINFLNFGKKIFAWCWKLHFTCPEVCSEGKNCFKKHVKSFFGHWAWNISKFLENFSGDLSKMQSMPAEGILGGREKVRENFFSFGINSCHECQYWTLRVQRKKNLSKYILFHYFWAENFSDFWWNSFRQSCQTCNPCYRECFYKRG